MDFWEWIGTARSMITVGADGSSGFDRGLVDHFTSLLTRPDLLSSVQPRVGRHADDTSWIYYDGALSLLSGTMGRGQHIHAHNHGAWNLTGVVSGSLKYIQYERLDDRSERNYSKLAPGESTIVRAGETAVCPPPPHDIHEIVALEDGTVTVLLAPPFDLVRQYYYPDLDCYVEDRGSGPKVG